LNVMRPVDHASDDSTVEATDPAAPHVDETLIVEMLSLSVRERLRQNDRMVRSVLALRAAFARSAHAGTE
jgi:hypothetical protein